MSVDTLDVIERVEVPDDEPPPGHVDNEPSYESDATYRCVDCGTPLTYGGKGRPPTRCDEHKKSGSKGSRDSSPRGASGSVGLRAFRENFTQRGTEIGIMVSALNEIDGLAIIAGVDDVADSLIAMAQTNPKLKARLERAGSKMGLLGLVASVAGVAIPIACNHGVIPEVLGMPYIGKLRRAKAKVAESKLASV